MPEGVESRLLGAVSDESVLRDAYRAADVFAVPTVADVLAQTAQESIACGTPCVSFDKGGVTEVVRHLETGYLVPRVTWEASQKGCVRCSTTTSSELD